MPRDRGPGRVAERRAGMPPRAQRATMPTGFQPDGRNETIGLPREPHAPAAYDAADIGAVHALLAGTAQPHQQQRIARWIMYASGADELGWEQSDPYSTSFAQGKRWIGLQFRKLALLRPSGAERGKEHG